MVHERVEMKVLAVLCSLVVLTGLPICSSAAFYRYYDESGGVNVTNDVKGIPERYRVGVTVITEKELENKAKSREKQGRVENGRALQNQRQRTQGSSQIENVTAESSPPASEKQQGVAPTPDTAGTGWVSRQLPLLKVMGVIVLFIAGFIFVGRFISALAPRPLAIIIRIALFAALSVYLLKGYSEKIADVFAGIKNVGNTAQKAVDKRSEKIRQQAE